MHTMKAMFDKFRSFAPAALLAVCAVWLAGCASDPADVEDRSIGESPSLQSSAPARVNTPPPGGSYRVVKGDTLYSIAFKRGLDYRDVAAWNGIAAPAYKILVGQEIRLSPPGASSAMPEQRAAPAVATAPVPPPVPVAANTPPAASRSPSKETGMFEDVPAGPAPATAASVPDDSTAATTTVAPAAPISQAKSPVVATPTPSASAPIETPPATAPVAKAVAEPPPPAKPINDSAALNVGGVAWRWPNGGKVIGTYVAGDQTKQGVDIAGSAGDPVLASADGDVVYSGNGLLGYGELIIVKHNASFLSAYGHNRKRLVAEGDKVRAGQQIAEMGSSASSRDELHFEIRKNGKPVNPLDYLPPR